jgi:hypothetical protein
MNKKWLDINIETPYNNEPVYYYFDVFDRVYVGYFCQEDVSFVYNKPYGTYKSNIFYSKHGFLSDDVKYWMPREDTDMIDKPKKPNMEN